MTLPFVEKSIQEDILPNKIWVAGLHSHFVKTNESSEIGFPRYPKEYFENYASRAYEMALEAGLSAWGVTDYNFDPVRWAKSLYPEMDFSECSKLWESVAQNSANRHTIPGKFLALSGFEYGKSINYNDLSPEDKIKYKDRKNYKGHVDSFGDIVIYNAPYIAPQQGEHDIKNVLELPEVYKYISSKTEALGIFAHPSEYKKGGKGDNFNNLELNNYAIDSMVGFEIWNGASIIRNKCNFFDNFILALQKGWKVGAMYNQDNFLPNWGNDKHDGYSLGFTIVIPPYLSPLNNELTKENFLNQLRKRKFYGSLSNKLILGILTEDGATMGDTISLSRKCSMFIQASGIKIKKIRVYHGIVGDTNFMEPKHIAYKSDSIIEYQILPPSNEQTAFYFVEAIDETDNFIAHSSPIWITHE